MKKQPKRPEITRSPGAEADDGTETVFYVTWPDGANITLTCVAAKRGEKRKLVVDARGEDRIIVSMPR